jgi:hypothetical protein
VTPSGCWFAKGPGNRLEMLHSKSRMTKSRPPVRKVCPYFLKTLAAVQLCVFSFRCRRSTSNCKRRSLFLSIASPNRNEGGMRGVQALKLALPWQGAMPTCPTPTHYPICPTGSLKAPLPELSISASAVYQAASAVAMPIQPPICVVILLPPDSSAIVRKR